ncbi:hypothetical protein J2W46_003109 [Paraburkholderia strydomiana]|nr:hypothetical protein [Paraburkholderia strydomiana]
MRFGRIAKKLRQADLLVRFGTEPARGRGCVECVRECGPLKKERTQCAGPQARLMSAWRPANHLTEQYDAVCTSKDHCAAQRSRAPDVSKWRAAAVHGRAVWAKVRKVRNLQSRHAIRAFATCTASRTAFSPAKQDCRCGRAPPKNFSIARYKIFCLSKLGSPSGRPLTCSKKLLFGAIESREHEQAQIAELANHRSTCLLQERRAVNWTFNRSMPSLAGLPRICATGDI